MSCRFFVNHCAEHSPVYTKPNNRHPHPYFLLHFDFLLFCCRVCQCNEETPKYSRQSAIVARETTPGCRIYHEVSLRPKQKRPPRSFEGRVRTSSDPEAVVSYSSGSKDSSSPRCVRNRSEIKMSEKRAFGWMCAVEHSVVEDEVESAEARPSSVSQSESRPLDDPGSLAEFVCKLI